MTDKKIEQVVDFFRRWKFYRPLTEEEQLELAKEVAAIFEPEPTLKLENQRYWDGVYDAIAAQPLNVSSSKEPEPASTDELLTETEIYTLHPWIGDSRDAQVHRVTADAASAKTCRIKEANHGFELDMIEVLIEFLILRDHAETEIRLETKHQAEKQAMVAEIEEFLNPFRRASPEWQDLKGKWLGVK